MAQLDDLGQQRFLGLAQQRPPAGQVEVLDQLLSDRAAALAHLAAAQVHPGGAGDGPCRQPGVVEEAVVFGGQHRPHHVGRDLVEAHRPALLDRRSVERGEQRRLERRADDLPARDAQAGDASGANLDPQGLAAVPARRRREAPQPDAQRLLAEQPEGARRLV